MNAVKNIWLENLAVSKRLFTFAVPKNVRCVASTDIHLYPLIKAGFLLSVSALCSLTFFGEKQGSPASFCIHTYQVFSTMPKNRNLKSRAQGVLVSACSPTTTGNLGIPNSKSRKRPRTKAYTLILSSGLLSEFVDFSRTCDGIADTAKGRLSLIPNNL
jgi:hypothetical protein